MHFSNASISCNKSPQRCKSHHQSPLSAVERFISLDDDDVTGGFVVDDGVEERLVCSDDDVSIFLVVLSIGQAKNRKVSKIKKIFFDFPKNEIFDFTFEC
jgi:hypothetical protein